MEKNECANCSEKVACVPFFAHENTVMHMATANRRLLIALCVVCITFIATIIIFVNGYTIREKNWLDTLKPEVTDGIQQQSDPGTN